MPSSTDQATGSRLSNRLLLMCMDAVAVAVAAAAAAAPEKDNTTNRSDDIDQIVYTVHFNRPDACIWSMGMDGKPRKGLLGASSRELAFECWCRP